MTRPFRPSLGSSDHLSILLLRHGHQTGTDDPWRAKRISCRIRHFHRLHPSHLFFSCFLDVLASLSSSNVRSGDVVKRYGACDRSKLTSTRRLKGLIDRFTPCNLIGSGAE